MTKTLYIALFRVEFSGRGELSERQQKVFLMVVRLYHISQLGQHLSLLVRIAEEFNIAVVVINQCMADPGALSMFVSFHPADGLTNITVLGTRD